MHVATLIAEHPTTGAKLMTAIALRLAERLREASQKLQVHAKLVRLHTDISPAG